jgi:amino acid permease
MFGLAVVILIPLCLLKDISKMRVASLFSICSLIYAILVVVIECPSYYTKFLQDNPGVTPNWYDFTTGFTKKLYFFTGTATVFFAYTCHAGAFPVYRTLKNNVQRRVYKVFRRSIILDACIYVTIGICGFLTVPIGTPDLIIYRENKFANDIPMIIGRLLIAINLILSSPANFNAFRLAVMGQIGWDTINISNKHNLIITIPTILATCAVAAAYDHITDYISIMGGFISVVLVFLMPGVLYIKTNGKPMGSFENIAIATLVTVLCLIGFTAGVMTILKIFDPTDFA